MNDTEIVKLLQQIGSDLAEIKQMLAARPATPAGTQTATANRTVSASSEDKVFNLEIFDGTMREWKNGVNAGKGAYVRIKLIEPYEGLSWGSLGVRYIDGNPPFCVQQAGNKISVRGRISVREFNGRQDITIFPARNSFGNDDIWETAIDANESADAPANDVPAAAPAPRKAVAPQPLDDGDVPF